MDLDLKAIAPRADGKHSPLLHKYLRREKARRGVFQRTTDPISGDLTAPAVAGDRYAIKDALEKSK